METIIRFQNKSLKQTSLIIDRPWLQMDVGLFHEANGPWKIAVWSPERAELI
ncbi:hypothetical protein LJK87_32115 [Paenibacillus sp. P25]|nr:hypothetical protein LJK87_32115 [Paenibacillus sp. P25]